jgi:hypothetical protein
VEQIISLGDFLTKAENVHGDKWMADCIGDISVVKGKLN